MNHTITRDNIRYSAYTDRGRDVAQEIWDENVRQYATALTLISLLSAIALPENMTQMYV